MKSEVRELPDIPEIQAMLADTITKMRDVLIPICETTHPHFTLNALSLILISFATASCETNAEARQVIGSVCENLKLNAERWFDDKKEDD